MNPQLTDKNNQATIIVAKECYTSLQTAPNLKFFQEKLIEIKELCLPTEQLKNYTDYHMQIREKFDSLLTRSIEESTNIKLNSSKTSVVTELLSYAMSDSERDPISAELKEFIKTAIKHASIFGLHEKLYPSNILSLNLVLYVLSLDEKDSRKKLVTEMAKGFTPKHIFGVLCSVQSFCNYIKAAETPVGQYTPSKEVADKFKATVANLIQSLLVQEKITKGTDAYKYLFEQLINRYEFLMHNFDLEAKKALSNLAKGGKYAATVKEIANDKEVEVKKAEPEPELKPVIPQQPQQSFPAPTNQSQIKQQPQNKFVSFFSSEKYRNNYILALLGGSTIFFALVGMNKLAIASGIILLSCFMLRNVARFKSPSKNQNLLTSQTSQTFGQKIQPSGNPQLQR